MKSYLFKNFIILLLLCTHFALMSQEIKGIQFDAQPENLGNTVNSKFNDLSPVISPDGKTLFITRYPEDNEGKNNIWYSEKSAAGNWSLAKNIGSPLNIKGFSTSVQSVTPDGNTLLLSNLYNNSKVIGGGCSVSQRERGGWSQPQPQTIDKFQNKNPFVNYFLSNSGKFLLMAIETKKGYGEKDLYVSFKKEDNKWEAPINFGTIVNTNKDEFAPFLASDEHTLYFASNGHKNGVGGVDIWMSKRLDDTWTKWSAPINMGNVINTPDFDAYFTLDAKGEYAYFVSGKNSLGYGDIFRIKMPEEAKPDPVVLVYGKVFDKKTGKPIQADVSYELLPSGKEAGNASTNPNDNVYKIILPYGEKYGFMASAKNYYSITENVDLAGFSEYKEIEINLYLAPIEKNEVIRLNNIFFDTAKWILKEESFPELKRLLKLLNDNPELNIEIHGHTDDVGSDEDNLVLSKNRAAAVKEYLIANGIDSPRLSSAGFGESKPLKSNDNEAGRQYNRRVEFILK